MSDKPNPGKSEQENSSSEGGQNVDNKATGQCVLEKTTEPPNPQSGLQPRDNEASDQNAPEKTIEPSNLQSRQQPLDNEAPGQNVPAKTTEPSTLQSGQQPLNNEAPGHNVPEKTTEPSNLQPVQQPRDNSAGRTYSPSKSTDPPIPMTPPKNQITGEASYLLNVEGLECRMMIAEMSLRQKCKEKQSLVSQSEQQSQSSENRSLGASANDKSKLVPQDPNLGKVGSGASGSTSSSESPKTSERVHSERMSVGADEVTKDSNPPESVVIKSPSQSIHIRVIESYSKIIVPEESAENVLECSKADNKQSENTSSVPSSEDGASGSAISSRSPKTSEVIKSEKMNIKEGEAIENSSPSERVVIKSPKKRILDEYRSASAPGTSAKNILDGSKVEKKLSENGTSVQSSKERLPSGGLKTDLEEAGNDPLTSPTRGRKSSKKQSENASSVPSSKEGPSSRGLKTGLEKVKTDPLNSPTRGRRSRKTETLSQTPTKTVSDRITRSIARTQRLESQSQSDNSGAEEKMEESSELKKDSSKKKGSRK